VKVVGAESAILRQCRGLLVIRGSGLFQQVRGKEEFKASVIGSFASRRVDLQPAAAQHS
jgi:hypothetical protein